MILAKKTAKPLIQSGELVPTCVCVDKEKGTFLVPDNLRRQRTFPVSEVCFPGTRIAKKWFVADDGLRYYR